MIRLLHIVPRRDVGADRGGTYKDVVSRELYFQGREGVEYRRGLVDGDDPVGMLASLGEWRPDAVFIEYTHYPRLMKEFRARFPGVLIAVRAINVEPLQHLDNHGLRGPANPVWVLYGMLRLTLQDIRCKRWADVIMSINDWESRIYWNRLPGKAPVTWLPYICPAEILPAAPMPFDARRVIACTPTSQCSRKSLDMVTRFIRFAGKAKALGWPYEYVVTGNLEGWDLPDTGAVRLTGMISDFAGFMGTVRAVAVLSPLGYGVKTSVVDALAAGGAVLAHPALCARCPSLVRENVIPLDGEDERMMQVALERLSRRPDPDIQDRLKRMVWGVLDQWLEGVK